MKQSHHSRIGFAQEKAKVKEQSLNSLPSNTPSEPVSDTYRLAKTILHQSFLLPLPQIVQPVMWAYAMDTLALVPHPDFLILADECSDYHYSFDLGDEFSSHRGPVASEDVDMDDSTPRTCNVVNPGNFSHDLSFLVLYPSNASEPVQLSKVPQ